MKTLFSLAALVTVCITAIVSPAFGAETSCPSGQVKVSTGKPTITVDDKGRTVIIAPYVCKR